MRKPTYVLLAVLALQVLPVRGTCMSSPAPNHKCCPRDRRNATPDSSAVPECCLLSSLVTAEGSVAELKDAHDAFVSPVQMAVLPIRLSRPRMIFSSSRLRSVQTPEHQRLTPLSQTCLLLI